MTQNGLNQIRMAAAAVFLGASALAHGTVLLDQLGTLSAGSSSFARVGASGTRPNQTCIARSGSGFLYQTYTLTASGASPLNVHVSGVEGSVFLDTFVQIYSPSFDPNAPLTNCLGANDDSPPTLNSWAQILNPPAGTYTVVVTSFSAGATGDFRVCATEGTDELAACLETRRAIPTLNQWGIGGLVVLMGLVSGWFVRRRKTA